MRPFELCILAPRYYYACSYWGIDMSCITMPSIVIGEIFFVESFAVHSCGILKY